MPEAVKEQKPPLQTARVLVSEVNWLGDLVMSLPALKAVRRAFPTSHLAVLVREELASFFDGCSFIDEVLTRKRFVSSRELLARWRVIKQLRERRFDLAILFPNSFDSALIATLAGIPSRAGFVRDARGFLLTHKAQLPSGLKSKHQVHYWLTMLRETLAIDGEVGNCALEVSRENCQKVNGWLPRGKPDQRIIAVAPGSAYGPAKEWPERYFAALIDLLAVRYNAQVLLVGAAGERAKCERIRKSASHDSMVASGKTNVGELMALLSLCQGFAGNDSGSMHLAAGLGVPTVAIFGSTDPRRTGPMGPKIGIIYKQLECSPCFDRTCRFDHYDCLRRVSPADVAHTLESLGVFD
jgi:heptosyltransferase-2